MSKAQIATAAEPNDQYDQLSLDERDCFDRIASTGYKPFVSGSRWNAINGDGPRIGPCPSLADLESEKSHWTFERNKTEIDKCVLVCVRCHREIHAGLHPQYLEVSK